MMWETKTLSEISTISTGKWDANHSVTDGKYRFYTCASKHMYSNTKRFSGECLILPGNGANVGEVYYYNGLFDAYQRTYVIHNIKILPKFLNYHLLLNWKERNKSKQFGSATNFIKIANFNNYIISFPSYSDQQKIVSKIEKIFYQIDKSIKVTKDKKSNLENFKTSILSKLLNCSDYNKVKISDVCELQPQKKQVKEKLKENDEVSFIPMDILGINRIYTIPSETRKLSKVYTGYTYFENNDVLLAKITPCFENGKLGIVSGLRNGVGFGSSEYFVFRCNERIIPEFLYFYFLQESFRKEGKAKMTGAVGHKRVPKDFIKNQQILLPSISEQKKIIKQLTLAFEKSKNLEATISESLLNLRSLKSSILRQEFEPKKVA